jgi:hypothetical protein
VLLVGGSSVGKTRSAYEAIHDRLPDWWLLLPRAEPGVPDLRELAEAPAPRTVVWLDELQRYLGPHGLTADTVRRLLTADPPILLIGTLWPRRYEEYRRRPADGQPDPHAEARTLLHRVCCVEPDGAGVGCGGSAGHMACASSVNAVATRSGGGASVASS